MTVLITLCLLLFEKTFLIASIMIELCILIMNFRIYYHSCCFSAIIVIIISAIIPPTSMSCSLSNLIEFLVSLIQTLFVSMVMVGTVAITLQMLYTTLLLEVYFVLKVA